MSHRNAFGIKIPRWSFPFRESSNPHTLLILPQNREGIIRNPVFAKSPLPTALFQEPNLTLLRGSHRDQEFSARFLLFKTSPPQPRQLFQREIGMLSYVQVIATPTADTHGTCLLLHFDNRRYIIGSIAEGTQRATAQRNVGIQKVEDVFVTGLVNWHNAGGLLGTILVLADTLASKVDHLKQNLKERKKKGSEVRDSALNDPAMPRLRIHGGKNLTHLLATARRFIFRKGLPLDPHEVREEPRLIEQQEPNPDWEDSNVKVWYMPVQSTTTPSTSPRKRTHDEFTGASERQYSLDDEENRKLVQTVVTQMFDSDWKMDALIETTLHQAKLPAKLFVRDDKGHIQVYTGPLPENGVEVPDIPVLVRQPWPGAMVHELPRTKPSNQSMCYIFKTHERRGKFNPQEAEKHGVPKKDYKLLTAGQSVVGNDGVVVTPNMVLGANVPGNGFAVVDLPDASYIDALVNRTEWSNESLMSGLHVIYWLLGPGVVNEPQLQEFMQKRPEIKHIVSSPDTCPNRIAFESVAAQTFKLRCIDPDRFYLPIYDNEVSISNVSTAETSPIYESTKLGKMVQFAPQYVHQDSKIVPFPKIEDLARANLNDEVLEMARKAKARVSDPEFLSKVEKVESDIPNRDAEIIPLGTGSALPSKYRNVSSTLLRVPGYGNYLFDCGENTIGQLRRVFGNELPEVLRNLKGIWISHLHADHHLGTASVIKAWHEETTRSDPSAKLFVASHTHMIDWLREYADVEDFGFKRLVTVIFDRWDPRLGGLEDKIYRPREFSEREMQAFGVQRIDACYVQHCVGALATVFTFPSGLKVAYSGDCRPSDTFVRIGQGATLLIHESTFDDELRGDAIAKKHSTMSEAIGIGRRMGARRVLLTHFSQRYQKVPIMEENLEIRADPDADQRKKARLDEVVLVAFDYMRVKLGDFRKAQAFLPALQKLFEEVQDEQ